MTQWGRVLLIWLAGLGAAGQYAKVSVIYDVLPVIYPGGTVVLGLLVSIVGFVGILFGVLAGVLVSRIGLRRALLAGLWSGALLSALQMLFPPLPVMLALRALEGVSHLAIVVAAPTMIAQLSAPKHQGISLTLWSTFFGVAYTLIVWLGLPLVGFAGPSALFGVHALWLALFAWVLSAKLPRDAATTGGTFDTIWGVHGSIYRSPSLAAPAFGWLFYTFCYLAFLTLIPPFIPEGQRALVLGAMPLVSILTSLSLGVWLLRHLSAIQTAILGFLCVILCLAWLLAVPGGVGPCFAVAAGFGLLQGASFAAVPELNPETASRAQANGAMAQMGNLGNTLGTPVLALILSGFGYPGMILTCIAVFVLGVGVHLILARARMFA